MRTSGQILKELRERKNVSQDEVARAIGLTRTAYVKYETDVSKPNNKIKELSNYFNVPADYILGNESKDGSPLYCLANEEAQLINSYRSLNKDDKKTFIRMLEFFCFPQGIKILGDKNFIGNTFNNNGDNYNFGA